MTETNLSGFRSVSGPSVDSMNNNSGMRPVQTILGLFEFQICTGVVAASLFLIPPANAFVANASDAAPNDPIAAAPTTARWNANARSLADSGERGLGGGLEFSLDAAFCSSLEFVDGATCADIRSLIVIAGEKWGEGNPNIHLVDVSDQIAAQRPGNLAANSQLGAEINFFAVSRDEMEADLGNAAASTGIMVNYVKPLSTNGTTLWSSEGTITHANINFTTDHCYYLVTPIGPGDCVPFGLVLLHEIGHALGLGHPDQLPHWNLDSDNDPNTAFRIQCLDPLSGLKYSPVFDPDSVMISTRTTGREWEVRRPYDISDDVPDLPQAADREWAGVIRLDDYAGRDFLYPVCAGEDRSLASSLDGTETNARMLTVPANAAHYPIGSVLRNEQGRVLLNLSLAQDLSVVGAELHTSSGHEALDQAAIDVASNYRFTEDEGVSNNGGSETVLAEIVWQLPLRPAFDVGMPAFHETDLEALPRFLNLPEDPTLAQVPEAAAAAGEQGAVRVRITVSNVGNSLGADLIETSGFASLDDAAISLANAASYEPAMRGGSPAQASLEMAFAYETLPGNPSSHCYPYPISVNLPTMRMTYFSERAPPANENPSAERWVKVNEDGTIDTMILATELGWMHADEELRQRWVPSAEIPEDRPPQACWYYRPLLISRS